MFSILYIIFMFGYSHGIKLSLVKNAKKFGNYVNEMSPEQKLNNLDYALGTVNYGSGVIARTISVSSASWKLQNKDTSEETWLAYNQAMSTLMLADFGGGAMAPIIEKIIEKYIKHPELYGNFKSTFEKYNKEIMGSVDMAEIGDDGQSVKNIQKLMEKTRKAKKNLLQTFTDTLGNAKSSAAKFIKRHLNKLKNMMRLKNFGKALGPLFDVIGIALDVWTLAECYKKPSSCDTKTVVSAALGITSGLIGIGAVILMAAFKGAAIGTVGGPVAMVVGTCIGIAATMIGIEWSENTANDTFLNEQNYHSRKDLEQMFESLNATVKGNFYSVKGGQLLIQDNFNHITLDLEEENKLPKGSPSSHLQNLASKTDDGSEWDYNRPFYFWDYARDELERIGVTWQEAKNNIVMFNYDFFNRDPRRLDEKKYGHWRSRGFEFYGTDNNDIVFIGDMYRLNKSHHIKLDFRKGNDTLNLDGLAGRDQSNRIKDILTVDMGSHGQNVLSLIGINMMKGVNRPDGINIGVKGKFSILFVNGVNVFKKPRLDNYGYIKNVDILLASTGLDEITLSSEKNAAERGEEASFDFTVYKFLGAAVYSVDINHEIQRINELEKKSAAVEGSMYKITDNTKGKNLNDDDDDDGDDDDDDDNDKACMETKRFKPPRLVIKNLPENTFPNDIVYREKRYIQIYGDATNGGEYYTENNILEQIEQCATEDKQNINKKGGDTSKKRILATIYIKTRCPFKLHATTVTGRCILAREEKDIDVVKSEGKLRFQLNDKHTAQPTKGFKEELFILECPTNKHKGNAKKIDITKETRYIMLRTDDFLEPCGFGAKSDETGSVMLKQNKLVIKGGTKELDFTITPLHDIPVIINEYGCDIWVDKGHGRDVDLLKEYYLATAKESTDSIIGKDVAHQMQACINKEKSFLLNAGLTKEDCLD